MVHQVYPGTRHLLEHHSRLLALKGMMNGRLLWEFTKKQLLEIWKHTREESFCSVFLILKQSYPQRSSKNLSQGARWTFLRTGQKTTWFTVSRKDSLVAMDDQFALISVGNSEWPRHRSFWMYQFWCWWSISDITAFGLGSWRRQWHWNWVSFMYFMYFGSINMQIVKLRMI